MIFSGSRSARRRRRSCRARSPNSCSSAISASGGSVSTKPVEIGETVMPSGASPSTKADQLSTSCGRTLRRCRMSSSISRRPADSAAISTRPWKSSRKRASSRAGSSLRGSMRSPGGARVREVLIGQGLRQRIELDARQLDPAQRCEALHELVDRREHFGGLEDRTLGIVPALLVPARDLAEHLRGRTLHVRFRGDDRVPRQVVEQRRGGVEEQRQVVLDARRRRAFGDVAVDRPCASGRPGSGCGSDA